MTNRVKRILEVDIYATATEWRLEIALV